VRAPAAHRYILLHKPRGYVTTRSDPEGRRTVMDLVAGLKDTLYPVGRLDYDSEGLLLLTNDGDLTARLTHPRHGVPRTYEVEVKGLPDAHARQRLARGIVIEGRRTRPAEVTLIHPIGVPKATQSTLRVVVHEGRNRQVRRMCDAIGHPVIRLRRVSIGPISDSRLKPGAFRDLRPDELRALKRSCQLPVTSSKVRTATPH
jgi:pseudouridine synthase